MFILLYVIVYNYIHDDDCDLDIQFVSWYFVTTVYMFT